MRSKVRTTCALAAALLLLVTAAFLPGPALKERIQKGLQDYLNHFPPEKVYLQTDKDYYASGSTIWFKAYVTSDGHRPTDISTILYVEMLDKKGKVLDKNKLPIRDGGAWGEFTLPQNLKAGDYRLRAYTLWMLNFDPAFLFNRDIHVYEAGTKAPPPPPAQAGFAVQFFPEGGDLVDSLPSLVAFKAIGTDGYPLEVSGYVADDAGRMIDSIRSVHDGMGSFTFTPLPGRTYHAVMKDTAGQTATFPLPASRSQGVVLHLIRSGAGRLFFEVRRRSADDSGYNRLDLVAQTGGHLAYFAHIDFSQGYTGGLIPLAGYPSGILQVTVFTPAGVPLAERLAFVRNQADLLPLALKADSISLQPRGKNSFTLQLPDSVRGNFSVAVTDADQVHQSPDRDDIYSSLLLTSDIKGNVYDPAWYFASDDSATNHGLDLVMLTNGWRRFSWQNILNGNYPQLKYPPESHELHVTGQAFGKNGPLKNGAISMFLRAPADTLTYFISGATQSNGYFEVTNLHFHDTADLYYKATDTLHKGRDVSVRFLANPAAEPYTLLHRPIKASLPAPDTSLGYYLELAAQRNQLDKYINNHSILLKEVTVTARKVPQEEKTEDRYTSGMFKSDNGYTFDLTNKTIPYTSIFQYLQGRVPGLMIMGNPMDPSIRWRGGTPGFFLDEVPVSADELGSIPVDDIALVKVYRPPFYGGFGGANGAIAIYTKKGGDESYSPGRGFERLRVPGYTIVRQFYSPDYSVNKRVNQLPDKRATLYWKPELVKDSSSGPLTFSFYNSDIARRMRIIVEGITDDGRIARVEKVIR